MANKLFQIARSAVQQAVGRFGDTAQNMSNHTSSEQTQLSGHDMEVAQNALSSAMANSSDAERAQLAELQQELDAHSHSAASKQAEQPDSSLSALQDPLEDNQQK
ncbi:DUF3813 domain-containing protein [Fictibacillus nanhaiensis]|uniref:DUF3813 domain-containing protein n=1 Tax=Fictibacillus nanhaiensis TaxID=742169 RepID=UPI001C98A5B4|nr:DUF3813 domain-containing protein [Fictibacillus nanhaiensis]